jgi:hypothetical protein
MLAPPRDAEPDQPDPQNAEAGRIWAAVAVCARAGTLPKRLTAATIAICHRANTPRHPSTDGLV